ncbi:hypothetical protein SSP24_35560 [Streptomyces spinoverrucosus]|uniref:Uncharacterized protein n=1 Tax=Streptomyces spinoverrucosus TaxID=284043 RepID=A0A4Y3VJN7_9ACTN|nr:hypothetical protein SSP24_35560 [Streptomyces spinoverrucosus]GHB74566.1 hypothetical protein GCM10010397_51330 [Streptomyces spinoverrucosus]
MGRYTHNSGAAEAARRSHDDTAAVSSAAGSHWRQGGKWLIRRTDQAIQAKMHKIGIAKIIQGSRNMEMGARPRRDRRP